MAATSITRGRLRRLAEFRPDTGRVLSVFVDLDPTDYGTPAARASQFGSVVNEARRHIEALENLDRDSRLGLREDTDRIERLLDPTGLGQGGVRGLAIFACAPADFLEVMRLPYPVQSRVVIDDTPHIEPLALMDERERLCVALVSRTNGRILLGDEDGLVEIENVEDDVKGQHDQGGWSQARYQRGVEEEKRDHLDNVADELFATFRFRPFDRLLVAAPDPLDGEFEARLHPYLQERLAGRIQVDVENSGPSDVLAAAKPVFEAHRRERESAALERLRAGLGRPDGRAVAGVSDVLFALNEQRVETLLLEPRAEARGWVDPETGFLTADPNVSPREGAELREREDVLEDAVERAIEQSADILVVRHSPDLGPLGGVAALLRF
jgi:peptide chain release factor subunit 1